jgi:hypothetical protein
MRNTTREINLYPIEDNRGAVVRGMRACTIRRDNKTMIIEIRIGDQTVIIKVPP